MIDKLKKLEAIANLLEPSAEQRTAWNKAVQTYADQFIDTIDERQAFIETEESGKAILDVPFQEEAREMNMLIETIRTEVDTPGLNPASGGHLAYIPGGGIFPTALGDYLASISNRYAGVFFASPGAVRIENMLLRWMCQLIGFPDTALGNLTSGGSIANLVAVVTARDHKDLKAKEYDKTVIYVTSFAHHSVQKAIRIAGLREVQIRYIPVDDRLRMDVDALEKAIAADKTNGMKPFMVVASAGTTDAGAIDPLDRIADLAEQHELWYHVDAAYGGFFLMVDEIRPHYKGIERADSVTIDPHKGLFLAYGLGAVLIKNVEALQNSHYYLANYMQDVINEVEEPSPADLSPELTKHFRGMRMWLPMQLYGLKPFRAALEEKIYLCRYFYEKIQELGFEVGPYPELSVMLYRYVPKEGDANEFNAKLVKAVRADGRVFLSSTNIDGVFWLRLAVLAFRTHLYHIDLCLEVLEELID